jgi:hypothetical protein
MLGELGADLARAQVPGERPERALGVEVLSPRHRVPVSLIIDDSTALVNLAHFAIPQFAEVFPDQYKQDWRALPREIPDSFVRHFIEWCGQRGVKGKYSVVPYPACVGWLDRDLPGWTQKELDASLDLIRRDVTPNWDIHPEMVTHTWVIDTKTGRPFPGRSERFMENWRWTDGKSADELADYLSYALRVLKNVGLRCEGITTPGGFGNRVLPELSQATLHSVRDVFGVDVPHYFRHLYDRGKESVAPRVEYASGLKTDDPRCVISIIGCTGDWFGGWDGLEIGRADQFITEDGQSGRMVEVIARGEPAVMVCHWPGIYCNGNLDGFRILQTVVNRLGSTYNNLIWMTNGELARYWAARELTTVKRAGDSLTISAPFACNAFTLRVEGTARASPTLESSGQRREFEEARELSALSPGTFVRRQQDLVLCFDMPKGASRIEGIEMT